MLLPLISVFSLWGCSLAQYDRNWMGVAFGPYTKPWTGSSVPLFNSYSWDDIKQQLNLIGSKFTSISTYGMGVNQWNVNKNWWEAGDAEARIAKTASELNRDANYKRFSINQGIHQKEDQNQQNAEVLNAVSSARDSNAVFGGTVWGLTFTNEYMAEPNGVQKGEKILRMIRHDKNRAQGMGLKVGTRIHVCGVIENPGHAYYRVLTDIVRESDFIYCNMYPSQEDSHRSAYDAANNVANTFIRWRDAFKRINPNIEPIIGETGWPSAGKSFNNSPNTDSNLLNYWRELGKIAAQRQIKVQMFEAIDEPWKCNQNDANPAAFGGRYGAECHYGLWYRNSGGGFTEKRA